MAVVDRILGRDQSTDPVNPRGGKLDGDVKDRLKRGREAMLKDSGKRRMCFKMWRGEQYWWLDEKGALQFQPTVTSVNGAGKPPHRVRTTRNFIRGLVEDKVSNATNRTPGYDISPTTTDPQDASAARLSQKAAFAGYDKWSLRKARVKAVTNALVADGGYAMPYWDSNVGPFIDMGDGRRVGQGEVKVLVLNGNQVAWEPGTDFDDSPWHAVLRARTIAEVQKTPGYIGGKLNADATTSDVPTERATDNMVLVTEYFERPCPDYPDGRKLTIANDKLVIAPEPYPCRDARGNVVDEPVLHQLVYTVDPDRDRDMGLVEHLIDSQKVVNNAVSKSVEWVNRALNPRISAPVGSLKKPPTDEPGGIDWFNPVAGMRPEWQQTPAVPRELFQVAEEAKADMREIAGDVDVSADANVAARTVQQVIEKSARRWGSFLADLAEFDSRLMRHCLYLVARHYTEPRLLELRGHFGWESIQDFRGADLRGQCNVRVLPDSLQSKTRTGIRDEIQFFTTTFPGVISPEAAMAAWHGGLAESLIQGWELDVAACAEVIKAIQAGPDVLMNQPSQIRTDPVSGQPQEIPWWMPAQSANVRVWKQMLGDWMNTPEYRALPPDMKAAAVNVYDGVLHLEEQEAMRQAQMQTQLAQQQGMANAAASPTKPLPSQPGPTGQ